MKTCIVAILALVSGCGPQVVDLRVQTITERDSVVFFEDTWLTGVVEEYYGSARDAQIRSSTTYKDGEKNGLFEMWHSNGQIATRTNYQGGKPDGSWEQWHSNSQVSVRATFKDGLKDGLSEEWFENGQLANRSRYDKGEKDGLIESWYENGRISEKSTYEHGRLSLNQPQGFVLGESIRVSIFAAKKDLNPIRVTIDEGFRTPHWIGKGNSMSFTIQQSISLEREVQESEIWIEGNRVPQRWLSESPVLTIDRSRLEKWLRGTL